MTTQTAQLSKEKRLELIMAVDARLDQGDSELYNVIPPAVIRDIMEYSHTLKLQSRKYTPQEAAILKSTLPKEER